MSKQQKPLEKTFHGFGAEIYDLWWPEGSVGGDESFYKELLRRQGGNSLEVGCGTGRILLPLLRENFELDGLDYSNDMLNICRDKLKQLNLSADLYQSPMQDFNISKKYNNIYVPFHSFMIVSDRSEALQALKCFFKHLKQKGQLIISLFVPKYQSLSLYAEDQDKWRHCKEVNLEDGKKIIISDNVRNFHLEQIKRVRYCFEVFDGEKPIDTYIQEMNIRWYFLYEFQLMLENVGFKDITVYGDFTFESLAAHHREMTFLCYKS
jgi:ubiquinone/menaquinone biosynthesis C-methylase UbiE